MYYYIHYICLRAFILFVNKYYNKYIINTIIYTYTNFNPVILNFNGVYSSINIFSQSSHLILHLLYRTLSSPYYLVIYCTLARNFLNLISTYI